MKSFHPSCAKLHCVYNKNIQLDPYTDKIEEITIINSEGETEDGQNKKGKRREDGESGSDKQNRNDGFESERMKELLEDIIRNEVKKMEKEIANGLVGG